MTNSELEKYLDEWVEGNRVIFISSELLGAVDLEKFI